MKEIKEMPVFPGCEKVNPKQKKSMQACMTQQLTVLLSNRLKGFDYLMAEHQIPEAMAVMQMVISKEGIIVDVNATEESQPLLAEAAIRSLNQLSEELPPILPAKLKKGEWVNMYYEFPILYTIQLLPEQEKIDYPVDEIVLFTLKDGDLSYEVCWFKDRNIKVYELNKGNRTYLGKYLSMYEFEESEPYKSLLNEERFATKVLVTQGVLEDELYEINIYHLFNSDKIPHLEVVKINKDQRVVVATFDKELDFSQSKYVELIYRK